MAVARAGATATLLPSGRVLIAGGGTDAAELYNPATRRFTPMASPKTSADGTFSVKVTIPQAAAGTHSVSASGRRSFAYADATFTVTG